MDKIFYEVIESLDKKYQLLKSMPPIRASEVKNTAPIGGIYMFSEQNLPMYVGRTKRCLAVRIRSHYSSRKDCPFAWRLARQITELKPTYTKLGSRNDLLSTDENFKKIYSESKIRIKNMFVQYVREPDPLKQALLEIYVSVASKSPHNDFNTS